MLENKGYVKMPLKFDGHSGAKFEMQFAFRHIEFAIDTGKNDGISLSKSDEYSSFSEYKYKKRETNGLTVSSFNSAEDASYEVSYLVEKFHITKHIEIEKYPVVLSDTSHNLVGTDFLKNFDIILDFRKKQLYLKQHSSEKISKSFSDSFGFFTHWNKSQKLYISALTKESVAYKAGLEVGDRVLAINEFECYDFSKEDYCEMFLALNGSLSSYKDEPRVELTIKRGTLIKRVLLRKTHLF